jgi:hypothetical protein
MRSIPKEEQLPVDVTAPAFQHLLEFLPMKTGDANNNRSSYNNNSGNKEGGGGGVLNDDDDKKQVTPVSSQ